MLNYTPKPITPGLSTGNPIQPTKPAIQPRNPPRGISPGVAALMQHSNSYDNIGISPATLNAARQMPQQRAMPVTPIQQVKPMQQFQNMPVNAKPAIAPHQPGIQLPTDPQFRARMAAFGRR